MSVLDYAHVGYGPLVSDSFVVTVMTVAMSATIAALIAILVTRCLGKQPSQVTCVSSILEASLMDYLFDNTKEYGEEGARHIKECPDY